METCWVEPGVFAERGAGAPVQPASVMAAGLWLQAKADACVGVCVYLCKAEKDQEGKCNTKLGP